MIITTDDIKYINVEGLVVGITSGCFDLFHYYHLKYLERCKALCDFLIVGVDSDELVMANKNKTPMIPEHHRLSIINSLRCVDAVFTMNQLNDLDKFIEIGDILFKNSPNIYGSKVIGDGRIKLVIVPDIIEANSTTKLIEKIQSKIHTE